jgi:hypothetical protein
MFWLYDHQQGRVIHTDNYLRLLHTLVHPSDQVTYDYFLPYQSITKQVLKGVQLLAVKEMHCVCNVTELSTCPSRDVYISWQIYWYY